MPKKKTTRKAPPEAYAHASADRLNPPTEETAPYMTDADRAPRRYEPPIRDDRAGEPRLSWDRGDDPEALEVESHPLYIHEKIHPAAFVRSLTTAPADRRETRSMFGAAYNDLPENAAYEWYEHRGNWQNRLIRGDSRRIMASLADRDRLAGQVQMVYYDPPYGIKFNSNFQPSVNERDAGNTGKAVPSDVGIVRAFRDAYENGIHSYLDNIRRNAVLARTLLHESGSLFVQISEVNVHRLAVVLDEVFGAENRVSTIPFVKTGVKSSKTLPQVTDYLLWYAKDRSVVKFRQLYENLSRKERIRSMSSYGMLELPDGTERRLTQREKETPDKAIPDGARAFMRSVLHSPGRQQGRSHAFEWRGVRYPCPPGRHWSVSHAGMQNLAKRGRLTAATGGELRWKLYEGEMSGTRISNVWSRQMSPNDLHYVVETAESVVERCLLMTTDPSDLVLDITCGSGTTAFVAEKWGRRWITTDAAAVPIALARQRLAVGVFPYHLLQDSPEGALKEGELCGTSEGHSDTRTLGHSDTRTLAGRRGSRYMRAIRRRASCTSACRMSASAFSPTTKFPNARFLWTARTRRGESYASPPRSPWRASRRGGTFPLTRTASAPSSTTPTSPKRFAPRSRPPAFAFPARAASASTPWSPTPGES